MLNRWWILEPICVRIQFFWIWSTQRYFSRTRFQSIVHNFHPNHCPPQRIGPRNIVSSKKNSLRVSIQLLFFCTTKLFKTEFFSPLTWLWIDPLVFFFFLIFIHKKSAISELSSVQCTRTLRPFDVLNTMFVQRLLVTNVNQSIHKFSTTLSSQQQQS